MDETAEARLEAARRRIVDCDSRLAKYRAALDAGADATIVAAGWLRFKVSDSMRRSTSVLACPASR